LPPTPREEEAIVLAKDLYDFRAVLRQRGVMFAHSGAAHEAPCCAQTRRPSSRCHADA
jgi:hypothetical protein